MFAGAFRNSSSGFISYRSVVLQQPVFCCRPTSSWTQLRHPGKKRAAASRNTDGGPNMLPSEGKIRGSDRGTQGLNESSAPRLWILWIALCEWQLGHERQDIALV